MFHLICPRLNLGQNKIEQKCPLSPKSRMKVREGQNAPLIFPITDFGGRGGLNVPFNLSKIVGLDSRGKGLLILNYCKHLL